MKLIVILILIIIISIGVFYLYYNKNIETFVAPDPKYTAIVDSLRTELKTPGVKFSAPILPASNDASVEPGSQSIEPPVPGAVISPSSIASSLLSSSSPNSNLAPVLTTVSSTQTLTSQNVPVPSSKTSSLVNFIAIVQTFKPWGAYFAGNVSEDNNKLLDLFNRSNRDAVITGPIIKASAGGFGAAANNINYISGNTSTVIEWAPNSIPYNSTICSITRYTGSTNNKRILTARNATPENDWIHGHQSGKRGIVFHNSEYMVDNTLQITGSVNDWVVTCATTGGSAPNNVYINGVASGIRSGGIGTLQLAINKIDSQNIISESSDFALSYIIIWDTALSNTALKIISDNLLNYLSTGEPLLFDISSLNVDDKIKVQNANSLLIQEETQNALNRLREQINAPVPATPVVKDTTLPPASPPPTVGTVAPASGSAVQTTPVTDTTAAGTTAAGTTAAGTTAAGTTVAGTTAAGTTTAAETKIKTVEEKAAEDALLLRAANLETILAGKEAVIITPSNNVINLNNQLLNSQAQTARSSICTLVNKMPSPEMSSFTQDVVNIPLTSTNTADQSVLWCKCDGDDGINANTRECKMFDVCRKNYANNNKLDYKATFTTINTIDKQTYDSCTVVFENFPRYLDTNTSNQNRPARSI
jgi:hypothetical protein